MTFSLMAIVSIRLSHSLKLCAALMRIGWMCGESADVSSK